jgi:hypothetical protein
MGHTTEKTVVTQVSTGDEILLNLRPREVEEIEEHNEEPITILYLSPLGNGQDPTPYSFKNTDEIDRIV